MIVNEETHTSPRQRLVIFGIAVFMLLSTFALYASVVISSGDSSSTTTSALSDEEENRYEELLAAYQDESNKQMTSLSDQYFGEFSNYKSRVKSFNAADATKVAYEDLKIGDGAEVNSDEFVDYSAYYIGWLSDETIFDSSFDDSANPSSLTLPLEGTTQLIQGWLDGIQGMKIGGVREITIPAALGYGDQDQGSIPANSPLKFVIMLIPKVESVEMNEELYNLYAKKYGLSA